MPFYENPLKVAEDIIELDGKIGILNLLLKKFNVLNLET